MTTQKSKWKTWHKVVIGLCILGIIGSIFTVDKAVKQTEANLTPAEKRAAKKEKDSLDKVKEIEAGFNEWDGSHKALKAYVKESMNDPESFEHVETKYWNLGEQLVVLMTYRGKNAFGGVMTENVKAEANYDGTLIKVFPQE